MNRNTNPKGIAILGSTGSIGCNTLRVIESFGSERFRVIALGAGHNVETLADQIAKYLPELVVRTAIEAVPYVGASEIVTVELAAILRVIKQI